MICACKESREVWDSLRSKRRHTRSLALTRFVDFPDDEKDNDWRRRTVDDVRTGVVFAEKLRYWRQFVERVTRNPKQQLLGRLQSRLIVDAAGGVVDPGIDADVVTCHHKMYYSQQRAAGQLLMPVALAVEDPEPIVFPAVSAARRPQFAFVVLANARGSAELEELARGWLRKALETIGIGGKTAAGYGWFQFETGTSPAGTNAAELAAVQTSTPTTSEHSLISQWRGHATTDNLRVILPELAAIEDTAKLRRVFDAIIPKTERNQLRKNNRYWQSFSSRADGQKILQRLGITLK